MLCCKKVLNTDLLQLALAVILLRLSPENYFNNLQWNENSEVREIFLGANSAYAQSNFHASRGRLQPYSYPKNIDSIVLDETLSVFEHINYYGSLNQFRHRRNDFLAFYSSSNQSQNTQRRTDDHEISHHGQEASTNESQENSNNASDVCVETQCSAAQNDSEGNFSNSPMNLDLTREDMDLIEILWKQDIDLGVSRDAFDSRESHEVDKLKPSKNHKELQLEENFNEIEKFQDEATPFSDPWEGLNYTIDSETGEHVIQEQLYLEEAPEINNEESLFSEEVLNELSENLYLPLTDNNEEFMSLTTNETFFNLFESRDNEALDDQDHMLSQLNNLEKMIKKEESFTPYFSEDQEMVSDLFPSTEDCWQDITTTLPLSVMGSTHNEASLSLFTRPLQSYSGITGNNSVPILNHPASTSDSSNGILIHNATLASPAADMNNSISYISATLGPSSIGCAVAASMATLTNDTEPVPDGSMVNTTYHPEFTELMYSNHTSAPSQGEYLLSDLLLEEDLQLIEMGNSAEANYTNHLGGSGENMDASSDSAVSLTSGRVPSISDCPEWVDSCSESSHQGEHDSNYLSIEGSLPLSLNTNITRSFANHQNSHQYSTAFPHSVAQKKYKLFGKKVTNNVEEIENENGDYKEFASQNCHKDEIYMSAKHSSNELAVASTYGPISMEGAAAPHDQDFTINIPIASGGSYAQYPQHNHSYHLPFVSSSYTQKPLMRDKTKGGNGDEETLNRDEKRARALKLPITIDDIINLAIDEFNEKLSKYELTEPQLTLIRDIRRRGKNKVAAQNCRKRKMDQITILQQDIDLLQSERLQLETEQTRLLQHRRYYQDKYTQLYEFVAQACSQTQHPDSFHPLLPNEDNAAPSHLVALEPDKDTDLNRGARTKRKFEKK